MANVLVQESSLQAIAAAIRLKNGSAATYTPSQMAAAIEAITGGGGSPASLGSKTIKINGTFQASSDGVDGFSDVTIDVHPGILEPYSEDLSTGYVDTGVWKLSGTNCFSDVYDVEANTAYVVALGGVVGTRFRAMFCTDDPTIASSNITGTSITNINNPAAYTFRTYTPSADGFIIIQKDNAGTANLKTYVFALPDMVDGNVVLPHLGILQPLTVTVNGNYSPSAGIDGFSSVTVNVPTEASTLVSKSITENGVYDPADDDADGYSALTVDVHPGLITPYVFDLATGYVYGDSWKLGGDTVNYTDVYQVTAGEWYIISLGSVVGSRFRAIFTTEDTTQAAADIPGTRVANVTNPAAHAFVCFKPNANGYITITKDNAGVAGLKTFVYSGLSMANANP